MAAEPETTSLPESVGLAERLEYRLLLAEVARCDAAAELARSKLQVAQLEGAAAAARLSGMQQRLARKYSMGEGSTFDLTTGLISRKP